MQRNSKTILTTTLLLLVIFQGPYLYYYTSGFIKLFMFDLLSLAGLLLTIGLLIGLFKNKLTNTKYHLTGLIIAFTIGLSFTIRFLTSKPDPIENLDWKLRKSERSEIIDKVKKGLIKPNSKSNAGIYHLLSYSFPPISNDGNDIIIDENNNGIVSIEFYIDRGFLDHYAAFLYTNDPKEIEDFDKNKAGAFNRTVKKLDANWYRVAY